MLTNILLGAVGVLAIGLIALWKYSTSVKVDLSLTKKVLKATIEDNVKDKRVQNEHIKLLANSIANPTPDGTAIDKLREGKF
jgi:hypothetical protein